MNYELARQTLATWIKEVTDPFPTLTVFWDNTGMIDLSKVDDVCLLVEFYWDDAGQKTMENNPIHRTTGSVYLTIFAKVGKGSNHTLRLMDLLTTSLKYRATTGLCATVPRPGRRQTQDGWMSQEVHLPFYFDSTT